MLPTLAPAAIDNENFEPSGFQDLLLPKDTNGGSAADRAYAGLNTAIVSLQIPPGEKLARKKLSHWLGVSFTPLRDALLRLEIQGLIETRPQAETRVSLIDKQKLFELHFLRVSLETEVVRRLAHHGATEQREFALKWARDAQFHAVLFQAIGLERVFSDLMERYKPMQRCQNVVTGVADHARHAIEFQHQILDRIRANDPKGAVSAMRALLADEAAGIGAAARERPKWFR